MIDWNDIGSVFLDLDGTLLDLHFDNHFWREHVPLRYAEDRGLSLAAAKAELFPRFKDAEGTMEWYCLDHWSRELGLDIALLKQEVDHLIAVHPHVVDFLEALERAGKRRVLVTNAHQKALSLKLDRTRLGGHFEAVICAHDLGLPKEDPGFWQRLQAVEPFDPIATLFVDDSLSVLRSARRYGLRWLLAVLRPDTRAPLRVVEEFPAIRDFSEIMPVHSSPV
jgi:putative hydrolase of the HAD superfamily